VHSNWLLLFAKHGLSLKTSVAHVPETYNNEGLTNNY
jgi:hypothetical protein